MMMMIMERFDERVLLWGREEEGERRKEERAWYLLQAKPRLLIGWRDSAGYLTSPGESRIFEARLKTLSASSPSSKRRQESHVCLMWYYNNSAKLSSSFHSLYSYLRPYDKIRYTIWTYHN